MSNGTEQDTFPIKTLKVFAYINLIGGIAGALLVFVTSIGSSREESLVYLVIAGLIAGALFGCAFLLVVAGMAENLIAIRESNDALLKSGAVRAAPKVEA